MSRRTWTRREFGQAVASLAGASAFATAAMADTVGKWSSSRPEQSGVEGPASRPAEDLAFVGSAPAGRPNEAGTIHVFRTAGEYWTELSAVPAAAPAHLLLHPVLPVLYAVHNVDTWDHLPRGAVSAYRVDRLTGRLDLLASQALSLSATHPRHAVLTSGATHLFVAAEGGGIYNLLPLDADGTLLPVSAIRKEFGVEQGGVAKLAAPNSVALLPDGSLLAADAGQETLTNFIVADGMLLPRHRTRVHRGEGPANLSVSPCGRFAYTTGAAVSTVRRHRLTGGRAVNETELRHQWQSPLQPASTRVRNAISLLLV